jgi:hypothetical protein
LDYAQGVVTMNFGEALQAMKDGKRVCRKEWKNKWLAINNLKYGYPSFVYSCKDNSIDEYPAWYPSQEDMLADDWEIKPEEKVNNGRDGLLYLSLLMFFFAMANLRKEQDTYYPFNS